MRKGVLWWIGGREKRGEFEDGATSVGCVGGSGGGRREVSLKMAPLVWDALVDRGKGEER